MRVYKNREYLLLYLSKFRLKRLQLIPKNFKFIIFVSLVLIPRLGDFQLGILGGETCRVVWFVAHIS